MALTSQDGGAAAQNAALDKPITLKLVCVDGSPGMRVRVRGVTLMRQVSLAHGH